MSRLCFAHKFFLLGGLALGAIAVLLVQLYMAMDQVIEPTRSELRGGEALLRHRDHLLELVDERTPSVLAAARVAETANRVKSEFLARMSHELRTPLNAVTGFSQLMARSQSLSPDQQRNLEIIHRSGQHLLPLVNDVLARSKIEAGGTRVDPVDTDLAVRLRHMTAAFRYRELWALLP